MILGKYSFHCRFEKMALLPVFKGSTFRGVFGTALKKVICALKQKECRDCLLRTNCLYVKVFEPGIIAEPLDGSQGGAVAHPFVIEPPMTSKTEFEPGSEFNFHLLLFGEFNNYLPYFVYAFEQMGRIGLGKKIGSDRGSFRLESVWWKDRLVYSSEDQILIPVDDLPVLTVPASSPDSGKRIRLELVLETPLRLKFQNHLYAELPFHVLVRAMLRRMSSLMNQFGPGEPDLDYSGMVAAAKTVETAHACLQWVDWRRYSLRQDQSMLMGGMTGSVVYEGRLDPYLPVLEFCREVHIGKQTTFGLGKISSKTAV